MAQLKEFERIPNYGLVVPDYQGKWRYAVIVGSEDGELVYNLRDVVFETRDEAIASLKIEVDNG